ncbi:MAG TPA: DUF5916 domain-containing protein [Longimicrobiales bacterium]|nr:DUF5916 domain-containing protein [Longimicrobiales bacterium]
MILLLAAAAVTLQSAPTPYSGRSGELDVDVPRIDASSVDIDGVLDEDVWTVAARIDGFTQYDPVEGAVPQHQTEVLLFYDADAIYFGIRAMDSEPHRVLARLGERDRSVFGDDWVRIMLDTFNDARQAYVFYVNPLGIQTDGLWIEGLQSRMGSISIDFNPDFIWESRGRVTDEGWVAEIRIPYVSLRFREQEEQVWGFNALREVRRTGYKQAWAPLTQDNPSTLVQSGRLTGIRDIEPGRLVEVNPVVTGSKVGSLDEDGVFGRDGFEDEYGLNLRYGLTRNLTVDATVNPDFSQVEADATRLTTNERFAVFYREARPFFLEGSEIFQMPRNLVYTRRIVDPSVGGKLTGKVGPFQIGYLGALDESPSRLDPLDDDALFNIVRARADIGSGSTLGLVYTDRTVSADHYNRVLGTDLRLLWGRHTFTGQLAGAWDAAPGVATASARPLFLAQIERSGREFGWNARLEAVDPDFTSRSGFINRTGDAQLYAEVRRSWFRSAGSLLESYGVTVQLDNFFGYDDLWNGKRPYEHEIQVNPTVSLRGGRSLTVILRNGYFRFRDEDYTNFGVQNPDGSIGDYETPPSLRNMLAAAFMPRIRINDAFNLNGRAFFRTIPIYLEGARGFEVQLAPSLTVRPTDNLETELAYTWSRIRRTEDDSEYSRAQITRAKVQVQLSRSLLVRLIGQYNMEERSALMDPTTGLPITVNGTPVAARDHGDFQGQFLVQFEPSPGTIFYVGYSRFEVGPWGYSLSAMNPVEDGLFVKLSYLFRL